MEKALIQEIPKLLIHLPERTDRLDHLKTQEAYFPIKDAQIVSGVKHNIAYKGIGQAHVNCVMLAKQKEWDRVLIMEDDVLFQGKSKTLDHVNKCLESAPEDWDVLLGGVYLAEKLRPYNLYWNRIGEFCGLHFYIVNSKAYDKILEYDFKTHIDRWMNQKNRLNCYVMTKFAATQIDGYSDNVKEKTDYKVKLAKFKVLS